MKEKPNLLKMNNLPNIHVQQYERYLPTAFDDSMSILEKINKVINYLYEYSLITEEMLSKWNEVYEWVMNDGLNQAVLDRLQEWLDDGTLESILENLLLYEYARKDWVEEKLTELMSDIQIFKEQLEALINEFMDDVNSDLDEREINVNRLEGSDTFRIQTALNMCRDKGGGTVFLPTGKFILEEELNIYSNTTIRCSPNVDLERHHEGYMLINGDRGDLYSGYAGQSNITLIGGNWDGRAHLITGQGKGSNIAFAHCRNIEFVDVTISNANSHHLELNSTDGAIIENCKFIGALQSLEFVEAVQLDLATEGGFPAFGRWDSTPCKNITIKDCYFGPSAQLPSVSRGFGTHSTRLGAYMENVTIENNIFDRCRDYSIQMLSYKNTLIKNNRFIDCVGGIICYALNTENVNHALDMSNNPITTSQPPTNITIDSNFFTGTSKSPLYLYGRPMGGYIYNVKIINNTFRDITDSNSCIIGRHTRELIVANNSLSNINSVAISLNVYTLNALIKGNILSNISNTGIRVMDVATDVLITGNKIHRGLRHGINVYGSDVQKVNINNNTIHGTNGANDGSHGIYVVSSVRFGTVNNNQVFRASGYIYERAIYVTNSNIGFLIVGNLSQIGSSPSSLGGMENGNNSEIE